MTCRRTKVSAYFLIPRGPMVTASGYDVSYFCNQKIPGSSPGGEENSAYLFFSPFLPSLTDTITIQTDPFPLLIILALATVPYCSALLQCPLLSVYTSLLFPSLLSLLFLSLVL